MSFANNAIFWVEVDKINPNPYQPRRDFDAGKLQDLADSIRQYGVLQPLVVTRTETYLDDGSMRSQYELIAGERRLRAARLAGISQVPVVIRDGDEPENIKLELAIIENLQREDLNPVDRARAFFQLANDFGHKHGDIGRRVGRSREYVSNTIRILGLPEEMLRAIAEGKMREGHSRPLLMLVDRPEEQRTLFKEILHKNMTVHDAEQVSKRIAYDRARTYGSVIGEEVRAFEEELEQTLGTRVHVLKRTGSEGGKLIINFATEDDLQALMERLKGKLTGAPPEVIQVAIADAPAEEENSNGDTLPTREEGDDDIYSISNFSI
ncbi:ParB/RepB/Spo0J family partition protein [Candidatus Wolfebacteria bacterium]|nr:ParB/RepB/Spo0J family partition protein [Candidatus Wolfebacteria bacterium]